MSIDKKIDLLMATSMLIDVKKKRAPRDTKTGKNLGIYIFKEYKKLAKEVLADAKEVELTNKEINKFLKRTNKTMNKLGGITKDRINNNVEYQYKYAKNFYNAENKKIEKLKIPEVEFGWFTRDDNAVMALQKQMNVATGTFYSTQVEETVRASVIKNVYEMGLSPKKAKEAMIRDLSKALKLKSGTLESKVVPIGFRGTADDYFKGLSEFTSTNIRTVSKMYSLDDVDIKKFRIFSINSDVTCVGCLEMDGTTFEVKAGVQHVDKLLGAESKDDLKDIQPFFHFDKPGNNTDAQLASLDGLKDAIKTPPFHFRCECFLEADV